MLTTATEHLTTATETIDIGAVVKSFAPGAAKWVGIVVLAIAIIVMIFKFRRSVGRTTRATGRAGRAISALTGLIPSGFSLSGNLVVWAMIAATAVITGLVVFVPPTPDAQKKKSALGISLENTNFDQLYFKLTLLSLIILGGLAYYLSTVKEGEKKEEKVQNTTPSPQPAPVVVNPAPAPPTGGSNSGQAKRKPANRKKGRQP